MFVIFQNDTHIVLYSRLMHVLCYILNWHLYYVIFLTDVDVVLYSRLMPVLCYIPYWCQCCVIFQTDACVVLYSKLTSVLCYIPNWCQCCVIFETDACVVLYSLLMSVLLYSRLTPVYMLVIMFYCTLWRHIPHGPRQSEAYYMSDMTACHQDWWTNLLYINNFHEYITSSPMMVSLPIY